MPHCFALAPRAHAAGCMGSRTGVSGRADRSGRLPAMRNALLAILLLASPALAVDIHDTRLLTQPAISENRVAFSYANDLWVARLDGSEVRRLTSHPGVEGNPRFSPDGKWIAFSGEYDGNVDVFVVPTEGGVPR